MSTILLIGCGKEKRGERSTARELYTGSLFVARRKRAEASGLPWWIISAKYGLLTPGQLIEPYDLKLDELPVLDRHAWALDVVHALLDWLPNSIDSAKLLRCVTVEVHAGADYAELLRDVVLASGMSFSWPVKSLSQGEQMAFYSRSF